MDCPSFRPFDNKSVRDYPQMRAIVVGSNYWTLEDTTKFILSRKLLILDRIDAKIAYPGRQEVTVCEVMMSIGMLTSKNEYRRKEKEGAIRHYGDNGVSAIIDLTKPSVFHEIRLGQRFLEVVVAPNLPIRPKIMNFLSGLLGLPKILRFSAKFRLFGRRHEEIA